MASNDSNVRDDKKGLRILFTVFAYVFFIAVAVAVLPVVLPPIFGYHTHTVSIDTTGNVSLPGSVVYTDKTENQSLVAGNIVALDINDGKKVKVSYVDSNDVENKTVLLRTNETVSYDKIEGRVVAKTPFVGFVTRLCDAVLGIVLVAFIFVVAVVLAIVANKLVVKKNDN